MTKAKFEEIPSCKIKKIIIQTAMDVPLVCAEKLYINKNFFNVNQNTTHLLNSLDVVGQGHDQKILI